MEDGKSNKISNERVVIERNPEEWTAIQHNFSKPRPLPYTNTRPTSH